MKKYDLEDRTFLFAKNVRIIARKCLHAGVSSSDVDQLIRSSGSVAANYIEANESISKKDFIYRLRISRKEAKECHFWLRLILETTEPSVQKELEDLTNESLEIKRILSAIIQKATHK